MSREELPRIFELIDGLNDRTSPNAYFQDFEKQIKENLIKMKHFLHIESDLENLDSNAWEHFKKKVVPLFEKKHTDRAWQPAFDIMNEAKAYKYLIHHLGCVDVKFIPQSNEQKTPDLCGRLGETWALCEVKTINSSDDEARVRGEMGTVRSVDRFLPEAFFRKLKDTLENAKKQLDAYSQNADHIKIIYIILNFDDNLHENFRYYMKQINHCVAELWIPEIEIILDVKPEFYSATCNSLASRLYVLRDGHTLTELEGN
jgi:hypothetical protein